MTPPSLRAAAPAAPPAPPPAEPDRPAGPSTEQVEYEKKVAELEKRLAVEHEQLLLANLKSQQEAATAARVEVSIKELQEKLRRDRREAAAEEDRRSQQMKVQELEARLAQERETWVVTLKNQMGARESQEKEVEGHFAMRLQEMERRWLEEKAGWQKAVLAKDEEIRALRTLSEKLKGADAELAKTAAEKKQLEARVTDLMQERAEAVAKVAGAAEKEKDAIQMRADLSLSRQQLTMVQERLERDLAAARMSAREREERLLSDHERLQRDLATVSERLRAEHEADLRRLRIESEAETAKHKTAAERSAADLSRLRAVCGALERQLAATRAQADELKRSASEWEKTQERFKAEFVVLQRKWVEREKEIRAEAAAQAAQVLEAEKARLKAVSQEEMSLRASRLAEQMEKDGEVELRRREAALRVEIERGALDRFEKAEAERQKARLVLEAEVERLRGEMARRETEWGRKLLAKETEFVDVRGQAADLTARRDRAEEMRREDAARLQELDKSLQAAREELGALRQEMTEVKSRLSQSEQQGQALQAEKSDLERLAAAQSAQVKAVEETLERLRGEVAREANLGRLYMAERDKAAGELAAARDARAAAEAEVARQAQEMSKLQEAGKASRLGPAFAKEKEGDDQTP
jgi:chromosome segregation ATPase